MSNSGPVFSKFGSMQKQTFPRIAPFGVNMAITVQNLMTLKIIIIPADVSFL